MARRSSDETTTRKPHLRQWALPETAFSALAKFPVDATSVELARWDVCFPKIIGATAGLLVRTPFDQLPFPALRFTINKRIFQQGRKRHKDQSFFADIVHEVNLPQSNDPQISCRYPKNRREEAKTDHFSCAVFPWERTRVLRACGNSIFKQCYSGVNLVTEGVPYRDR